MVTERLSDETEADVFDVTKEGGSVCLSLIPRTGRRSITTTGAPVNRLSLAMAGRCQRMLSKIRCSSWLRTDIAASRTTGVVMDARVSHGAATIWIRTRTISLTLLKLSI